MQLLCALSITEEFGCFSSATVQYTRNLKQARVILTRDMEVVCGFEDEVQLELIINSDYRSQLYIFDNFSLNISEITMQNVEINETVIFSYLNISSISFYTMVRVGRFAEVSTLMDQCVDVESSAIIIRAVNYQFNLSLTQACYDEMLSANSYEISFGGYATTIEIDIINGVECTLDAEDSSKLVCEHDGDFAQDMEIPFLEVIIIFEMHVKGNDHTVQITFDKPYLGTYSALYAAENRVTVMTRAVYVYVVPESELAYVMENAVRECDKIYARFLARNSETREVYEMSEQLLSFYVLRTMFVFECENEACQDQLKIIRDNYQSFSISFDVCFFQNEELVGMVSQYLSITRSCFETARIYSLGKNKFDIALVESGEYCAFDLGRNVDVALRGMRNELGDPIIFDLSSELPAGKTRFTIDCTGISGCTEKNFQGNVGVVIRMNQDDILDYAYVGKCDRANYEITLIVAVVFGLIFFIGSLYDSISKIIVFERVIKAAKKK